MWFQEYAMTSINVLIAMCLFLTSEGVHGKKEKEMDGLRNDLYRKEETIQSNLRFLLYTRNNREDLQRLSPDDVNTLMSSQFKPSRKTKFVIHGYLNCIYFGMATLIKDALLDEGDYNVIVVEWGGVAGDPYNFTPESSVPSVGEHVGTFLRFLFKNKVSRKNVHLIGHGLGAHVAGFAGKETKRAGQIVDRITGLDPAYPSHFKHCEPDARLTIGDADFVDVIHTGGSCFGSDFKIGDADFYPNGGNEQPGCNEGFKSTATGDNNLTMTCVPIMPCAAQDHSPFYEYCSHMRAVLYFAESAKKGRNFYADSKCDSIENGQPHNPNPLDKTQRMGLHASRKFTGYFYLTTNNLPPFSRN